MEEPVIEIVIEIVKGDQMKTIGIVATSLQDARAQLSERIAIGEALEAKGIEIMKRLGMNPDVSDEMIELREMLDAMREALEALDSMAMAKPAASKPTVFH